MIAYTMPRWPKKDDKEQIDGKISSSSTGTTCTPTTKTKPATLSSPHHTFYKDQPVTVDNQTETATIQDCEPNKEGKVLVQFSKWIPLDQIHDIKSNCNTPGTGTGTGTGTGGEQQQRAKRKVKRPEYFLTEELFQGRDGQYSSVNMAKQKSNGDSSSSRSGGGGGKLESAVQDVTYYDSQKGIFTKLVKLKESVPVAVASAASCKRKIPNKTTAKTATKKFKSNEITTPAPTRTGTKKNGAKLKLTLWDIHAIDKDSAIHQIKSILPTPLKNRAAYIGEFFLFCHERQMIWFKRKNEESRPWTQDPILASKHFTNLYRELDAGTVYFHRRIIESRKLAVEASKGNQKGFEYYYLMETLWASICYRLLCRVQTFEKLGGIPHAYEWEDFKKGLKKLQKEGGAIFTGAFQVMGYPRYVKTLDGLQENERIVLDKLAKRIQKLNSSGDLQGITKELQDIENIGPFLAWQITCDLLESNVIPKCNEADADWVELGPGAKHGLNYIFGKHGRDEVYLCRLMRDNQDAIFDMLKVKFERFDDRELSLKVLEHAICEFHKYSSCLASKKTAMAMRFYSGANGCSVPVDTEKCADCEIEFQEGQENRCCNTCWRYFCRKCGDDSVENGEGDCRVSWICQDCEDLK